MTMMYSTTPSAHMSGGFPAYLRPESTSGAMYMRAPAEWPRRVRAARSLRLRQARPKSRELDLAAFADEDVLRSDAPVHEAEGRAVVGSQAVHVVERLDDGQGDVGDGVGGERLPDLLAALEGGAQRPPLDQLGHEPGDPVGDAGVDGLEDRGVVEPAAQIGFVLEAILCAVDRAGPQPRHGDGAVPEVGAEDIGELRRSQPGLEFVGSHRSHRLLRSRGPGHRVLLPTGARTIRIRWCRSLPSRSEGRAVGGRAWVG